MPRAVGMLGAVVLIVIAISCEPPGPKMYPVSGTVTWNGKDLPEGDVVFIDLDQSALQAAGKIKDGKFDCKVQAGKKTVQIYASREKGEIDPAMGAKPREQYIPARYNVNTTLKAEVKPEGPNEYNFPLKEKP